MKFISYPELTALTNVLAGREIGGSVLEARVETYSCKETEADKRLRQIVEERYGRKSEADNGSSRKSADESELRYPIAERKSADGQSYGIDGKRAEGTVVDGKKSTSLPPRGVSYSSDFRSVSKTSIPESDVGAVPSTPLLSGQVSIIYDDDDTFEYQPDPRTAVAAAKGRLRADSVVANTEDEAPIPALPPAHTNNKHLTGPLDMSDAKDRRLFASLLAVLNNVFPDYDFSGVRPSTLERSSINSAIAEINTQLSEVAQLEAVEPMLPSELESAAQMAVTDEAAAPRKHAGSATSITPVLGTTAPAHQPSIKRSTSAVSSTSVRDEMVGGWLIHRLTQVPDGYGLSFTQALWRMFDDIITLQESECFTLGSDFEGHPLTTSALWSFTYFFYNKNRKKVLFFSCCSRSKLSSLTAIAPIDVRASPDILLSQSPTPTGTAVQASSERVISGHKRPRDDATHATA